MNPACCSSGEPPCGEEGGLVESGCRVGGEADGGSCLWGHYLHLPIQSPSWREDQDVSVSFWGVCHQRPDLAKEAAGQAPALSPDPALNTSSGSRGNQTLFEPRFPVFSVRKVGLLGFLSLWDKNFLWPGQDQDVNCHFLQEDHLEFLASDGVTPPTGGPGPMGRLGTRHCHTGGAPSVELRRVGTS